MARVEADVFTADLHRDWWIVRGPNGGYLAAVLLRALRTRLDAPDRAARSLTVHYLEAPKEGEVRVATAVRRSGRSLTTVSATMEQGGRPVALALAAFSRPRDGADFADAPMPDVPAPDSVAPMRSAEGMPPIMAKLDLRPAVGTPPFGAGPTAETGGWMRLAQPRVADEILVAGLTEFWAPAVFAKLRQPAAVPTVDLTVHFRATLPRPGARPGDFVLGRFRSMLAAEGFVEEDAEIWAADGTLLAQSRQLAVLLS